MRVIEFYKNNQDDIKSQNINVLNVFKNLQSRENEEAILRANIPYRIYGGLRIYKRLEIKNAITYLKIIFNHSDNPAFERSMGSPPRGVGQKTLLKIRNLAKERNISYIKASAMLLDENMIGGRGATGLRGYLDFILRCKEFIKENSLSHLMEEIINVTGLKDYHGKEPGEKGKTRIENLEELISATRNYEQAFNEEKSFEEVAVAYLDMVSLDSGDMQASEYDDAAQLMTIHSAKGLEFKLVLLTGLEESLFPHGRSIESQSQLEEERRLCYVGITRAMEKLYLTYAESRRLHGQDTFNPPSRFIREIPSKLINEIRPRAEVNIPYNKKDFKETKISFQTNEGISLGQKVRHKKFGDGVVLNYEGSGDSARLQINFESAGTKWLVLSYANLEVI